MDKITPHMYSAAVLVLVALFCTWSGMTTTAADVEISNTTYKMESRQSNIVVMESATVLNPLQEEPSRLFQNPFLEPLEREGTQQLDLPELEVPRPPPPVFMLPEPLVLPLPGEQ